MRFALSKLFVGVCIISLLLAVVTPLTKFVLRRNARVKEIQGQLDYVAIRAAGRELLATADSMSMFIVPKSDIPADIAQTNPSYLSVCRGVLRIEYGDRFGQFGLNVGAYSHGSRNIDGVRFYEY